VALAVGGERRFRSGGFTAGTMAAHARGSDSLPQQALKKSGSSF
jgi:hypothetical protein